MKTATFFAVGGVMVATTGIGWAMGRADARQPGTAQEAVDSYAGVLGSGLSNGIRVVINGTTELAAIVPASATTAAVAEGGDDTGAQ